MLDSKIVNKYISGEERLLQEHDRIRLSELVAKMELDLNAVKLGNASNDWTVDKMSKLIEAFIINVPVPSLIFYEIAYHKYRIIDGRQRIGAVVNYFSNKFPLTGLEIATQFNGLKYSQLPVKIQRMLDRCNLSVINIISNGNQNSEEISAFIEAIALHYK